MFYKYSPILGRIISSTRLAAYKPSGLNPLKNETVSPLVFESSKVKFVKEVSSSSSEPEPLTNLGVVPNNPKYKKLMENQEFFLKDDGKLVWQKKPVDNLMYYTTLAIIAVGLTLTATNLYKMYFPTKKED